MSVSDTVSHEQDFYGWAMCSVELIRQGRLAEIDLEHGAEELENMGASRERELESRLGVLLAQLLKWRHQPELRGKSWRATIKDQRRRIEQLLQRNPSLNKLLPAALREIYGDAVLIATRETPFEEDTSPVECPFTLEQTLDDNFWPSP